MNPIYEPEYVKKLFNQMSSSYERMNFVTSFGFSIRWRKQFLNKLGKSNDNLNVVDILYGLGENWSFLKRNFPNSTFYALDFSENMIAQSQKKANKIFDNKLKLLFDNMLENKLDSNIFDIVSCAYGLKTFNEKQINIIAKEVHRILKPGGKFSFVEVSKPRNKLLLYFYKWYLGKIIPILGKLFLGNSEDYKMLWIYTSHFDNARKVKEIFQKYDLLVNMDEYFGGCATGIHGQKI